MAVQPIYVDVEEEIPELIERLKLSGSREIPVVVPARSRIAQSRFNFQLLRDYAGRLDKRIAIISTDPAVQRMASENGFSSFAAVDDYADRDLGGSAVAPPVGARTAPATPFASRAVVATAPAPEAVRESRPPRMQIRPQPLARGPLGSSRLIAGALAGLFAIFALLGAALFVPSARVTLIAQAKDFSLSTDIQAAPGAPPVKVRLVNASKQASRSFPATGQKVTPAVNATGSVVYTNKCTDPFGGGYAIPIKNGQRLLTASGVVFAQLGDVQLSPGTTPVNVVAVNSGPTGNLPSGSIVAIAGNQSSCLSVTNREATGGGADEVKQTLVTQGDLDAARAQLDSELKTQVTADLAKLAQPGEKLADTIDWKLDYFADHKASDPVSTFSATATQTANGAAYNGDDVKKALVTYLQKNVPRNQALTDNAIATDFQVVNSSPDGHLAFHGSAKGYIAPKIDFSAVRARLAGRNTGAARSYLSTLPVNSPVDLNQQPFQLPIMPFLTSRIDIRYEVQAGSAAART